mmetsp:Transcript_28497/g.70232  ORF Transcript_28497/g.70232 Transcript_28497/m.70232 type:complete len:2756 (+) Transcript_28497:51-8318(+)
MSNEEPTEPLALVEILQRRDSSLAAVPLGKGGNAGSGFPDSGGPRSYDSSSRELSRPGSRWSRIPSVLQRGTRERSAEERRHSNPPPRSTGSFGRKGWRTQRSSPESQEHSDGDSGEIKTQIARTVETSYVTQIATPLVSRKNLVVSIGEMDEGVIAAATDGNSEGGSFVAANDHAKPAQAAEETSRKSLAGSSSPTAIRASAGRNTSQPLSPSKRMANWGRRANSQRNLNAEIGGAKISATNAPWSLMSKEASEQRMRLSEALTETPSPNGYRASRRTSEASALPERPTTGSFSARREAQTRDGGAIGGRSFFRPPSLYSYGGAVDSEAVQIEGTVQRTAPMPPRSPVKAMAQKTKNLWDNRFSTVPTSSPHQGQNGAVGTTVDTFRRGLRANVLRQALLDSRPLLRHDRVLKNATAPRRSSLPENTDEKLNLVQRFSGGEMGNLPRHPHSLSKQGAGGVVRAVSFQNLSYEDDDGNFDTTVEVRAKRAAQSAEYDADNHVRENAEIEMDNALFNCLAFVPIEVVARLIEGLDGEPGAQAGNTSGAFVTDISCAVLFSDVSGFTQLTERLQREKGGEEGAELLNGILNNFFEQLITIVHEHDGDVIKFAGDAVLSMWSSTSGETLAGCVARASACALRLLEKLDFYQGGFETTLRLHLGLGAGHGQGIDVGTIHRREFVVAGPPLEEMSAAEGIAGHGEVVVGPRAWQCLQEVGAAPTGVEVLDVSMVEKQGVGYYFLKSLGADATPLPERSRLGVPRGEWVIRLQKDLLCKRSDKLLEALKRYTAEPVRHHIRASSLQYSTEFREATMLFVRLTRLRFEAPDAAETLQLAVLEIMKFVSRYEGTITRISIDDKGTVLKVTFGLPPFLHTDDPTRGVLCAMGIRDAVRQFRLRACIGITTGHVFVGCVGAEHRCEYTEYGDKVNLAARYMSNAVNEILTDEETYLKCAKTVDWDVLKPITVKGKEHPVPAYRPFMQLQSHEIEHMSEQTGAWGRLRNANTAGGILSGRARDFVGRIPEMLAISQAFSDLLGHAGFHLDFEGTNLVPENKIEDSDETVKLFVAKGRRGASSSGVPSPGEARKTLREAKRKRILVVTSEAGLGKTRLVEEMASRMRMRANSEEKDSVVLTGRGSSTETSNLLYPWTGIFRRVIDLTRERSKGVAASTAIKADTDIAVVAHKLMDESVILKMLLPARMHEHASLLNGLLSQTFSPTAATLALADDLKAEIQTQMLLHVLAEFAKHSPTLVVMEDCQYLDSSSWALLTAVASRLGPRLGVNSRAAASSGMASDKFPSRVANRRGSMDPGSNPHSSSNSRRGSMPERLGKASFPEAQYEMSVTEVYGSGRHLISPRNDISPTIASSGGRTGSRAASLVGVGGVAEHKIEIVPPERGPQKGSPLEEAHKRAVARRVYRQLQKDTVASRPTSNPLLEVSKLTSHPLSKSPSDSSRSGNVGGLSLPTMGSISSTILSGPQAFIQTISRIRRGPVEEGPGVITPTHADAESGPPGVTGQSGAAHIQLLSAQKKNGSADFSTSFTAGLLRRGSEAFTSGAFTGSKKDLNVSTRTHRESLHGRRQARESDAINRDHPESYDGLPALVFPPSFVLVVTLQTNSGISPPPNLATIASLPSARSVPLGAMSPAELVRIARNQLGARALSQKAARLLGTKSAGSPFFCLELVKLLSEQGVLYVLDGVVHVKEGKGDFAIPDSVEQTIVSRIDRLDRKYLVALKCASVAGNDFVDEMLLQLLPEVGVSKPEVPKIIAELCSLGLLERCVGSRYYTHSFKSALVKAVVYERLPFTQRRELHAAVAQWIEGRYKSEEERSSFYPVLANHWHRAALDGEAIHYFELCANLALKHYANHEAVGFIMEILNIVHACTPDERAALGITNERHADFALSLADASLRIGLVAQASEAVELQLALLQMPLPNGSPQRLRALLTIEFCWAAIPLSLRVRMPTFLRPAPKDLRRCEMSAKGYQTAARAFYFTGNVLEHDIVVMRGLDVAARVGGAQLCMSMAAAALAHGRVGHLKSAFGLLAKALALAVALPVDAEDDAKKQDTTVLYVRLMSGMLSAVECAWEPAADAFSVTMDSALELGMWRRYEESANQKALVLYAQAELVESEALFGRASASAENRKDAQMFATLACSRCALMLILGWHAELETAVLELEQLQARLASTVGSGPLVCLISAVVAMAQLQVAREIGPAVEAAMRALQAIRELKTPSQFALIFAYTHVTHVLVEVFAREPTDAHRVVAAEAVRFLEAFAARFRAAGPRFLLYHGTLAWLLGRTMEAARSWIEAARLASRLQMPYEAARIQWEVAMRRRDGPAELLAQKALEALGVDFGNFSRCIARIRSISSASSIAIPTVFGRGLNRNRFRASSGDVTESDSNMDSNRDTPRRSHVGTFRTSVDVMPSVESHSPLLTGAGLRRGIARNRMNTRDLKSGQKLARKRVGTDSDLIDRSETTNDRFDYSVRAAGLDWARGGGPGESARAGNSANEMRYPKFVEDGDDSSRRNAVPSERKNSLPTTAEKTGEEASLSFKSIGRTGGDTPAEFGRQNSGSSWLYAVAKGGRRNSEMKPREAPQAEPIRQLYNLSGADWSEATRSLRADLADLDDEAEGSTLEGPAAAAGGDSVVSVVDVEEDSQLGSPRGREASFGALGGTSSSSFLAATAGPAAAADGAAVAAPAPATMASKTTSAEHAFKIGLRSIDEDVSFRPGADASYHAPLAPSSTSRKTSLGGGGATAASTAAEPPA